MLDPVSAEKVARWLGVAFGTALAIIEVFYNWNDPSWWPFILVDYIAVALLLYGAWRSPRVLTAGWGFTCAMFWMAFFFSWELGAERWILAGMGFLFALTIVGLTLSVIAARHEK
jgi:hypothetical protein